MVAVKRWPHLQTAHQSGATAGAQMVPGRVAIHSISVAGDGTNNALAQFKNGDASGDIIITVPAVKFGVTTIDLGKGFLPFGQGVHVIVTGAGSDVTISYSELH